MEASSGRTRETSAASCQEERKLHYEFRIQGCSGVEVDIDYPQTVQDHYDDQDNQQQTTAGDHQGTPGPHQGDAKLLSPRYWRVSGARVYASPPSLAGSSSTLRTGSPPNTAAIQGFREPNCNTPRSKIPSSPKHTKTWGRDLQHLL